MGESLRPCLLMLRFSCYLYCPGLFTLCLDSSLPRSAFSVDLISLCRLYHIGGDEFAVAVWIEDDDGSALDRDLPLVILAGRSERESIDWRVCRFYDQTVNLNSDSICYFVT